MIIYGRHPIHAALEFRPEIVKNLWIDAGNSIDCPIPKHCHVSKGIPGRHSKLFHQGYVGEINEDKLIIEGADWKRLDSLRQEVLVVLDHIEDPQNFGAICRSAALLGATAIVYSKSRQAQLSPAVVKASSGLLFSLNMIRVVNIATFLDTFKKHGDGWVYGLDASGSRKISDLKVDTPICLVLGNEGSGISHVVMKQIDEVFYIPMSIKGHALNVAQSTSIALYQAMIGRYTK